MGSPLPHWARRSLPSRSWPRIPANGRTDELIGQDIALLGQEVDRCRGILRKLTSLGDGTAGPLDTMRLGLLIEEVAGPQRPFDVEIDVDLDGAGLACPPKSPELLYGWEIGGECGRVRRADFHQSRWDAGNVEVMIRDDGPGFSPDVLARLGEPYVTTCGGTRNPDRHWRRHGNSDCLSPRDPSRTLDAVLNMENVARAERSSQSRGLAWLSSVAFWSPRRLSSQHFRFERRKKRRKAVPVVNEAAFRA